MINLSILNVLNYTLKNPYQNFSNFLIYDKYKIFLNHFTTNK